MDLDHIINHLGEDRDTYFGAISPPIYQTSNFSFNTVEDLREAFSDEKKYHIYTRGNNPTVEILRKKLAALEKTDDALVLSSGIAAISSAVCSVLKQGDHVVCVENPYSWTRHLLSSWLARFGVQTTYVPADKSEELIRAVQKHTRLIYLESPNTMTFECQDFERICSFAKANGIITIADNSYASPIYQNPAVLGVDLVIHSATKYLNGHSDVVAGVICGRQDLIDHIFHNEFMTLGAIISPYEAAMILRGLRTLPIRVQRSSTSALKIAEWLLEHPKVKRVYHPGLPDFPQAALVRKQMKGTGGLFAFELATDRLEDCETVANSLTYFLKAVSWGGHESLVMPIATFYQKNGSATTHLPFQLFRLYIGLEDPDILIQDLSKAFDKI